MITISVSPYITVRGKEICKVNQTHAWVSSNGEMFYGKIIGDK